MTIRAFAFGDPATGIWGLAASDGSTAVASFASEPDIDDRQEESLIGAAGLELRFTPVGSAAGFAPETAGIAGQAQLCVVEGAVRWEGGERDVACLGMRAALELPNVGLGSARAAAAWFDPEDGFAVISLRPPSRKGHDADLVACALLEDGEALEVEEPRFSTTYDGDGVPARAGLELWLAGAESDEENEPEPQPHEPPEGPDTRYPRRAAGERAGDGAELVVGGFAIRAELFSWHARGIHGAGVYLLAAAATE